MNKGCAATIFFGPLICQNINRLEPASSLLQSEAFARDVCASLVATSSGIGRSPEMARCPSGSGAGGGTLGVSLGMEGEGELDLTNCSSLPSVCWYRPPPAAWGPMSAAAGETSMSMGTSGVGGGGFGGEGGSVCAPVASCAESERTWSALFAELSLLRQQSS